MHIISTYMQYKVIQSRQDIMILTGILVALEVPNSYFINERIHQISLQFNTYENISANPGLESRTLCMQPKTYIPTLCIWSMHIAQSSLTATPSFPSSFDTKTLTLSVKARGLIALVHLCPYRRSLPACLRSSCMASPQARCST